MRPTLLSHTADEALAAVPLSTRLRSVDGTPPPGHRRLVASRLLARRDFDAVADDLLCWGMHAGAGLRVAASHIPVEIGAVVELTVGAPVIPGLSAVHGLQRCARSGPGLRRLGLRTRSQCDALGRAAAGVGTAVRRIPLLRRTGHVSAQPSRPDLSPGPLARTPTLKPCPHPQSCPRQSSPPPRPSS